MGKKDEAPLSTDESGIPPTFEKNHTTIDFSMTMKPEIGKMRTQLIQELKTPFIEHVQTATSDNLIKQVKIESFDERVMTLSDKEIFNLYTDYLKVREIKNEKKKETVRNSILNTLELSFFTNGWILRRIFKRR